MRTVRRSLSTLRMLAHRLVAVDERTQRTDEDVRRIDEITRRLERALEALARDTETLGAENAGLERRLLDLERSENARADVVARSLSALHDTVNLSARRGAFARRATRVVVLTHHVESWDSLDDIVRIMRESEDFEPVVVSIPRRFDGDGALRDEELVHRELASRGVPHLRASSDMVSDLLRFVKVLEPDVIIRQSQWDRDVDERLAVELLTFARICVVPYETMNLVVNVPDPRRGIVNTAVDAELHRVAWLVFCANEAVRADAVRDGLLEGRQFRVVGHPKADVLRTARPAWPVPSEGPGGPRRPRVVWSSHHSIGAGWTCFGLFPEVAEEMLEWAREGEVEIVWMPHPALLPYVDRPTSSYSREQMDDWRTRWDALENTHVVQGSRYAPVLAAADAMMTDGLSMLVEFQVLNKPVLFLERSGHRPFTAVGTKVVEGTHSVDGVASARRVLERVRTEGDDLSDVQLRNVRELFGEPGAAARVVEVMREEIGLLRARPGVFPDRGTR